MIQIRNKKKEPPKGLSKKKQEKQIKSTTLLTPEKQSPQKSVKP